jgi:putative Mg2+ transporter-C (MgtC) family protein
MSEMEIAMKIGVIIVLSGLVGLDRELRHKPAGAKTHILVGLGSTIFTLASFNIFLMFGDKTPVDPGRIAAQIVTGIGFLGAGTIIQSGGTVRGLTTAASLWAVAGIGIATGMGMYYLAAVSTIAIMLVFLVINKIMAVVSKQVVEAEIKMKGKKIKHGEDDPI